MGEGRGGRRWICVAGVGTRIGGAGGGGAAVCTGCGICGMCGLFGISGDGAVVDVESGAKSGEFALEVAVLEGSRYQRPSSICFIKQNLHQKSWKQNKTRK